MSFAKNLKPLPALMEVEKASTDEELQYHLEETAFQINELHQFLSEGHRVYTRLVYHFESLKREVSNEKI